MAAQLAYDLDVPPEGTALQRAVNIQSAILGLGMPSHRPMPYTDATQPRGWDSREWAKKEKAILARKWHIPAPNKYHRFIAGYREPSSSTLEQEIKRLSNFAKLLHEHIFWTIYSKQPTKYSHYQTLIGRLNITESNWVPGCSPWERPRDPPPKPTNKLLKEVAQIDSVNSLGFFFLLFGAAHELKWTDMYDLSFSRIIEIGSRLICVTPFTKCGGEFIIDIVKSATRDGRHVPTDWETRITSRVQEYKRLIEAAYESGVLVRDKQFPLGRRWEELALLRFADSVGTANMRAALDVHGSNGYISPLCENLKSQLNRTYPTHFF